MCYGQCPCFMDNVHEITQKLISPWTIVHEIDKTQKMCQKARIILNFKISS
jgi:hypothetical protein